MDYKYDIFISYKWGGARKEWVDKVLYHILYDNIDEWIGDEFLTTDIFFKDTEHVTSGATLDKSLQEAVARSKCMICVVSLPYFKNSSWCPTEFSAMLYREKKTGIRETSGNHTGFIFPIIFVEEGEKKPENRSPVYEYPELRNLIFNFTPLELDIAKYNNTNEAFMKSDEFNKLKNELRRWVIKSIKPVLVQIKNNIPWRAEWATPEYILEPYQEFKAKYGSDLNPSPMPSIA